MSKIIIYLPERENQALEEFAQREYRGPQAQAAIIIRSELERMGLLPAQRSCLMGNQNGSGSLAP